MLMFKIYNKPIKNQDPRSRNSQIFVQTIQKSGYIRNLSLVKDSLRFGLIYKYTRIFCQKNSAK